MAIDIRTLTLDEIPAAELLGAHAFGAKTRHDITESAEYAAKHFKPEWYLGVFDGREMTSYMRILPEHMYLNGGLLGFGAVSPVANSPLHRRKGHSGAMMRRSLEVMRERGQVLSGLYTPHPAFYRRYGWEIASEWRSYRFRPKDLRLALEPSQRGSFRFVPAGDWQSLQPIHARSAMAGNGSLQREEFWWTTYVADSPWRPGTDVVIWQNDAGVDEGYAVYQQPSLQGGEYERTDVVVRELTSTSSDALLNLWSYFGRHDIHHEVSIAAAPHAPLMAVVADTERIEVKQSYAVLLRIVDFEAAMKARAPARTDDEGELTLRLVDETAPWNDGTWRVGVSAGKTFVERSTGTPDLTMPARVLAPLFNGYLSPRSAAAAGLLEASTDAGLMKAGQIFAVTAPPYFEDHF